MNLRQKLERILYTNLDLHPSWCRRCRGTITPFYRPYKVLLWIPNSCERGWNLPSVYERRKPVLISPDTQTHKISGTGQRKPSNNASQTVTQCEVHSVLCNIMFCGKWTVFFSPYKGNEKATTATSAFFETLSMRKSIQCPQVYGNAWLHQEGTCLHTAWYSTNALNY